MKKIISCLLVVAVIFAMAIPSMAAGTINIKYVAQDRITGRTSLSVTADAGEDITVYRIVNGSKDPITSFTSNGTEQDVVILFGNLPCNSNEEAEIYAVSSSGQKSNTITVSAFGQHTVGDWKTTKASTCTEDGIAVRQCSVCGKTVETKTLNATGHSWGEPEWSWSENYSSCTAIFTCKKNSNHINSITTKAVNTVKTVNPTCISNGSKTYSASVIFNNKTYTTSKTVTVNKIAHTLGDWTVKKQPTCTAEGTRVKTCTACHEIITTEAVPALGHDYKITYKWSADNSTCTATAICTRDKKHIQTETAKGLDKITKQATCKVAGSMTRTATFTNSLFKAQVKTASITGSHVDANKDNICDVCKIRVNTETTTTQASTTTAGGLLSSLFGGEKSTTTAPETATTEMPTEMITSIKFNEPVTGQTITQNEKKETGKETPKALVVLLVVAAVIAAAAAVILIIMLRKDSKSVKNSSKKETNDKEEKTNDSIISYNPNTEKEGESEETEETEIVATPKYDIDELLRETDAENRLKEFDIEELLKTTEKEQNIENDEENSEL